MQLVAQINDEWPIVLQHDQHSYAELQNIPHDNILLSPGPGHPECINDFSLGRQIIKHSTVPVLGICLGHQGIGCMLGGKVMLSAEPMHGRLSRILHNGDPLFSLIPESFNAIRYHSWLLMEPLPECLQVIARAADHSVMAVRHHTRPLWGVQYHPESIGTEYGQQLLINFNNLTPKRTSNKPSAPILERYEQKKQILHLITKKISAPCTSDYIFANLYADQTSAVWLDTSKLTQDAQHFSFMGCLNGPMSYLLQYDVTNNLITKQHGAKIQHYKMDIFTYLNDALSNIQVIAADLPFDFIGGFIGYLGYELHSITDLIQSKYKSEHPDAQFVFLDRVIVFDHTENQCYLLALTPQLNDSLVHDWFHKVETAIIANQSNIDFKQPVKPETEFSLSLPHACYLDRINRALQYIRAGESYEICLTNQMTFLGQVDPVEYYRLLRTINPSHYAAFFNFAEVAIASASIERFIRIDQHGNVEAKPMKGTLARGLNEQEDLSLKHQLRTNEKFQSENLMIVDLLRNDLGRVCDAGSIHVPKLMDIESYATVHQMVSTIRGHLRAECSTIDCLRATFPGGSMTGAPKKRTLQIIQDLETHARGIYSGALGYISLNGAVDLNIVIRTAIITQDRVTVGIGGAIIALSDPQEEFKEMLLKAKTHQETRKNF